MERDEERIVIAPDLVFEVAEVPALQEQLPARVAHELDDDMRLLPLTEAGAAQLLDEYEAWIARNVALRRRAPSPETVRGYMTEARQFLGWLLVQALPEIFEGPAQLRELWAYWDARRPCGIPVMLIDAQVARAFVEFLAAPGHGRQRKGSRRPRDYEGRYSPATLQRKQAALRSFFRFMQQQQYTLGNPLDGEAIRTPEDNAHKTEHIKALTQKQAVTLIRCINRAIARAQHPDKVNAAMRDKAIISLMMLQGLRTVEVQRLNVDDYTPNVWGDQGTLKLHGKGDKTRTVVLRPEMQDVLDMWLARRELYRPESDALFVSLHHAVGSTSGPRFKRLSKRAIRVRVDRYLERAGVKDEGVSCHALRHTYATQIVESARKRGANVDREGLARSMGHSDISIAEVYIDYVDMFAKNPSEPLMEILREADDDTV